MKVLLIEDDEEKAERITTYVKSEFPLAVIEFVKSLNAGLRALIRPNAADIMLLDMSMPNFNATLDDPSGGAHEHFAGRDILAQMRLRSIDVPTIVITMFDLFGEQPNMMSYSQLEEELKSNFAPTFRGMVYYNSGQEGWKNSLKALIDSIQSSGKP